MIVMTLIGLVGSIWWFANSAAWLRATHLLGGRIVWWIFSTTASLILTISFAIIVMVLVFKQLGPYL